MDLPLPFARIKEAKEIDGMRVITRESRVEKRSISPSINYGPNGRSSGRAARPPPPPPPPVCSVSASLWAVSLVLSEKAICSALMLFLDLRATWRKPQSLGFS